MLRPHHTHFVHALYIEVLYVCVCVCVCVCVSKDLRTGCESVPVNEYGLSRLVSVWTDSPGGGMPHGVLIPPVSPVSASVLIIPE